MMECSLAKAAESMQGVLQGENLQFQGVSTDTRTLEPGELFVALHGPNFDGSEFVAAAEERQAAAAVVTRPVDRLIRNGQLPVVDIVGTQNRHLPVQGQQ